ncbi:MAG TPA: PQQ-binding-like beta-propeller repeat protein [Bryobacteraceae bacterium]|nr:PQQ-binding-like beta-propeller repeat protein [Bryobacteraceae bacterium]
MRAQTALVLVCATILPLFAQSQADRDWPMFNRDLAGTRYSPLKQIDATNVARLTKAWQYRFNREGKTITGQSPSELYQEITPIVVNGVMYSPSGDRVVALEPETGKELWTYEVSGGLASFRGVAYWPGDRNNPPRIIFTTSRKMMALNARTGKVDPGFGKEGSVDLEVPYAGVPTVYKNLLFVGTNFYGPGERHIAPQLDQAGGQIPEQHAYDVRTGKELWTFHTIPRDGEPGNETWAKGTWQNRTGNNVWAFALTVDEERGILYIPVSGPGANIYGGDRPGANLFGNTLVALDANTGKMKWYFQTVHHELWDYNLPPAPGLIDIKKDGKTIPALAQVGKSGYMFILNRVTGEPVYGVEERPVPKSDVPGEVSYPTQPFPLKPPAISRTGITKDDIVTAADTTPDHAKACQDLWERSGLHNEGPFTPFPYHAEGSNSKPAIIFPGFTGGANWGGTATDPKLGYIFVNTKDAPAVGWMDVNAKYVPGNKDGIEPYIRSAPKGLGGFNAPAHDADGKQIGSYPCFKPPWGRLIAVNAATGDFAWQVPLGITESLPEGKQNTGLSNTAGPIVTAGGLVFIGSTGDNRLRAFDSRTGKELWAAKLDYTATAVPMTFMGKNGKQYVAIVAATGGGGGRGGRGGPPTAQNQGIYVFALP